MTIIYCPELFPTRRTPGRTRERDAYLRAHAGVDSAILADALGVRVGFIEAYQRSLGLRKCAPARHANKD